MRFMVSLGFYLNRPLGSGVLACKTPCYGVVMPLIPSIPCRSAGVVEGLEVTLVVQGIAERKGTFPELKCRSSIAFDLVEVTIQSAFYCFLLNYLSILLRFTPG